MTHPHRALRCPGHHARKKMHGDGGKVTPSMLRAFVLDSGIDPEDLPPTLDDGEEDVASENSIKAHLSPHRPTEAPSSSSMKKRKNAAVGDVAGRGCALGYTCHPQPQPLRFCL